MKNLCFLFVLALFMTACVDDTSSSTFRTDDGLELPSVESTPLARIDANNIKDLKFGMARIELSQANDNSTDFTTSMPSCYLTVTERNWRGNDLAYIEESGDTYSLGNTVQPDALDATQNTISFAKFADHPSNDEFNRWLETGVFPFIGGDYPFTVSSEGNEIILECSDCPMESPWSGGTTYNHRVIRLEVAN